MIYHCCDPRRRELVRANPPLNGIDFIEVLDGVVPDNALRQRTLLLRFLRDAPTLTLDNLELTGGEREVMVNSLHAQAIDQPAEPLLVEAVSDDGVIEAVSMPTAKGFVLGVQWHPEGREPLKWPLSAAMFEAFGDACREHCAARDRARRSFRAA